MKRELISYPKSGRTWLRYMLVHVGHASNIRFHHDGFEFNDGKKPPLNFDARLRLARYGVADRVVYLERDPRDVMVSLFYQVTGRFRDFFNYRGTISEFIRDPYFGAHSLRTFREMWSEIVSAREFLKITYKQMHDDRSLILKETLRYFEIPAREDEIQSAVKASTFERMRAVEEAGAFREAWLRKRNGAAKVRRGIVGGFRSELSSEDIEYLDRVFDTR
jgi:hypothetical protein